MKHLIGRKIDQYRIDSILGEGGMGAVFKAWDVNLDRPVALKVMQSSLSRQPQFQQRFMQEARAVAKLNHPNIVSIYQFGLAEELLYMVMAFVPGASLGAYVRKLASAGQVLALRETLHLLAQVADGLGYAHRQGIVHRDIKPDNILLLRLDEPDTRDNLPLRAQLTDFGLAKLHEGGVETATGTFMGTLPYMSPEQCLGRDLDGRSDLYAVGVMLFQMATGRLPFDIKTPTEAVMKHLNEVPPAPRSINPGLPARVEAIIQKSLAKEPEKRFASGSQFARALRAAAAELTAEDVTQFADPSTVVSLMTQLQPDAPAPAPSRMGSDLTAMPGSMELVVARQGESPRVYALEGEKLTIGRTADNGIVLNVTGVSRKHAEIQRAGDGWQVIDLGSTNGTFIGEHKLLAGVAQSWKQDETLRVGPFYMKWRQAAIGAAPAPKPVGSYLATRGQMSVPPGGTQIYSSSGQVSIILHPTTVEVEAGGAADVQVELLNQGVAVDHFRLEVLDLPAEWVTLPQDTVQLMPGAAGQLSIRLQPPRTSAATAGKHNFRLRLNSTLNSGESASAGGVLIIQPFTAFVADARPAQLSPGEPSKVLVHNQGNTPVAFAIQGRDPGDNLDFRADPPRLTVAPGERQVSELKVSPRQRPFIGRSAEQPFAIQVKPAGGDPQQIQGSLTVKPRLPAWLLPLFAALGALLCVAASFAFSYFNSQNRNVAATATAEIVAALTSTASADLDGDRLSLQQELALGTNPDVADTDGDGLLDGEEVNLGTNPLLADTDGDGLNDGAEQRFGTNPQVVDSDGDTIPDGQEVEEGTSPINPDTDDDGLNDNVDPDPGQLPTPTPTPTPTNTPTATPQLHLTETAAAADSAAATAAANASATAQAAANGTATAAAIIATDQAAEAATAQAAGTATAAAATATALATERIAVVYFNDLTGAQSIQTLLESRGWEITLYTTDQVASTDFSIYSLVIVTAETGNGSNWGSAPAVNSLQSAGVPVLGLGEGGYAFFGQLSLNIGYPNGAHGNATMVTAVNSNHPIWDTPSPIGLDGSGQVALYSSAQGYAAIYTGQIDGSNELWATDSPGGSYYLIIGEDSCYAFWGLNGSPDDMTGFGQRLFINLVTYIIPWANC